MAALEILPCCESEVSSSLCVGVHLPACGVSNVILMMMSMVDSGDVDGLFRMLMIEEVLMMMVMMVLKIENLRREKRAADKASPRIPSPHSFSALRIANITTVTMIMMMMVIMIIIFQLEACPPGGVSAWRRVLLEACPPGGMSYWRLVRWRDDCQPHL